MSSSHFHTVTADLIVPQDRPAVFIPALAVKNMGMTGDLNMLTHNITAVGTLTATTVSASTITTTVPTGITMPAMDVGGNVDMNANNITAVHQIGADHVVAAVDVSTPSLTSAGASISVGKPLNMNSHLISNLPAPGSNGDAANVLYVNTQIAAIISLDTFDVTFTGPWAAGQTVSISAQRVGDVVTLQIGAVLTIAATAAAPAVSGVGDIPAEFRPAARIEMPFATEDGVAGAVVGGIGILANGTITIAGLRTTGNFGIGPNAGWYAQPVTYMATHV